MMKPVSLVVVMFLAACPSDDAPPIDAPFNPPSESFATDVHPIMMQLGCANCHTIGGPGYEMSELRGGLKADFSGTADEVLTVLMAGTTDTCATTPARVCLSAPDASLFYTKPRLETGATDHSGISFPEDSTLIRVILGWIQKGAKP
ncbi:MAG: hypothetical protein H0T79_01470 [Deltaproteobacteria bacterium]|nr:hypothetical protein [Deltaproteobacteria bacterium]